LHLGHFIIFAVANYGTRRRRIDQIHGQNTNISLRL
jgi:hypothetical protein